MHMIRHKTICPYFNATPETPLCHQLYIRPVVVIVEKSCLPTIPALGYVVWKSGSNNPCYPCHVKILGLDVRYVNN